MKSQNLEEQDEVDVSDKFAVRNNSFQGEMTKKKASMNRSKHSETEQRRRSKINERFQTLMDLIPQNDQKRDKASFLLEVIEYVQYLQERLQMYEASNPMWNQGPTKLTPWRNNHRSPEDVIDQSQVIRNWPGHEKIVDTQAALSDAANTLESYFDSASVYKSLDLSPASPASAAPSYMKTEANISASAGNYMHAQSPVLSVRQGSWQVRTCSGLAVNNTNEDENSKPESSVSSSAVYSQGVLNTLTESLKSSGVDLSQTTISVQIDVSKRTDHEPILSEAASKYDGNHNLDNQMGFQTGGWSSYEESDRAPKRMRR